MSCLCPIVFKSVAANNLLTIKSSLKKMIAQASAHLLIELFFDIELYDLFIYFGY